MSVKERSLCAASLFELSCVHEARYSPDGRRVAYVVSRAKPETDQDEFKLIVEDAIAGTRETLEFAGDGISFQWAPCGGRLAFTGRNGGGSGLYVWNCGSKECVRLTGPEVMVSGRPAWAPSGDMIVYGRLERAGSGGPLRITERTFRAEGIGIVAGLASSLWSVRVEDDLHRRLPISLRHANGAAFSPDGDRLLFLGSDHGSANAFLGGSRLYTIDLSTMEVIEVLGENWFLTAAAWSPDGRIVVVGDRDSDLPVPAAGLWTIDLESHACERRTEGLEGHVGLRLHHDMPTWNTSQNSVVSVADAASAYVSLTRRGRLEIWRISLSGPPCCEPVVTGERACLIMDACAAVGRLLFCASDLSSPWELRSAGFDGDDEQGLTTLNQEVLEGWSKLRVRHLNFLSADGLELEGWHVSRADLEGPQPTILFIHGGPYLSVGHIFRFDFSLLASRGFAILMSNFRGSAGYGDRFTRGIIGDWGARGFPDHIATVDFAIDQGLAERTRLGVWGPSHGGFATAWTVTHDDRFKAAVAESAVTNIATQYYLSDAPDAIAKDMGGRPDEIPDSYRARSPLTYAARCRTPTLLLHGADDVRCPPAEAEQFYRALLDAGCVSELVLIPGMTHMGDSVGPPSVRQAQNEALVDWFDRFL